MMRSLILLLVLSFGSAYGAEDCTVLHQRLVQRRQEYRRLLEEKGFWNPLQANGAAKPKYEINPEHLPPVKAGKTPLPPDAEELFKKAIPDPDSGGKTWWARDAEGNYHRFQGGPPRGDGSVIAHWNGSNAPTKIGTPLKDGDIPTYIKKRYKMRDEIRNLVKAIVQGE